MDVKGLEQPVLDAIHGDGAVRHLGEAEGGVRLEEVLEADDLLALRGVHDDAGKGGVS